MKAKTILRCKYVVLLMIWFVPGVVLFDGDGKLVWGLSAFVLFIVIEIGNYLEGKFEDDSNDN